MRRWHTIVAKAALLVVAAVAAGLPHSSAAQVIRDDFNGRGFDRMIWAPCPRSENELSIVRDPALERAVARLTVRPRQPVLVLGLSATQADELGDLDDGKDERGRATIQWPSAEFRSLQSALDAAPESAVIEIAEGTYEIEAPLTVRGKRLLIIGAGSGRKREERITRLVGPPPNPVVDERGNLVLRAEAVEGLWNLVAADVQIKHMQLSGFDAGIVSKPDNERSSGPTTVKDVTITDTGRGILSLSTADLSVKDCTIQRTRWNAISFGPKFVDFNSVPNLTTKALTLIDPQHAGIYFENTFAFIDDVNVLVPQPICLDRLS